MCPLRLGGELHQGGGSGVWCRSAEMSVRQMSMMSEWRQRVSGGRIASYVCEG